jgi:hypothetical protein
MRCNYGQAERADGPRCSAKSELETGIRFVCAGGAQTGPASSYAAKNGMLLQRFACTCQIACSQEQKRRSQA